MATSGGSAAEAKATPTVRNSEHKVWGKLELDSSCDSGSIDAKLRRAMEMATHISNTDSSSRDGEDAEEAASRAAEDAAVELEQAEEEAAIEDNDPRLATEGSRFHADGLCKPCFFFQAHKACNNGVTCRFCHYHVGERRKRPGRRERAKMAAMAAMAATTSASSSQTRTKMSL